MGSNIESQRQDGSDFAQRPNPEARAPVAGFMTALQSFETSGDTESLLALFTDECELQHVPLHDLYRGRAGAERFWLSYRSQFQDVASRFRTVSESDRSAALEWASTGKLASGRPISYSGVTVLEFAPSGDKIRAFRTYYDSAAFLMAGEHHQQRH